MAELAISNLLNLQQESYKFGRVKSEEFYFVKIVDSDVRPNRFNGLSLRLIFEVTSGDYKGTHLTHILTLQHQNQKFAGEFVTLMGRFFDLSDESLSINTDELVGKTCQIFVEDGKIGSKFQKISQINRSDLLPRSES